MPNLKLQPRYWYQKENILKKPSQKKSYIKVFLNEATATLKMKPLVLMVIFLISNGTQKGILSLAGKPIPPNSKR